MCYFASIEDINDFNKAYESGDIGMFVQNNILTIPCGVIQIVD